MLIQVAESAENEAKAGLFGGSPTLYEKLRLKGGKSTLYQKLGLKGGSRIRIGLFGGSPIANQTHSESIYGDGDDTRVFENDIHGEIFENENYGEAVGGVLQNEERDENLDDEVAGNEQQGKMIENEAQHGDLGEFEGYRNEEKSEDEGYEEAGTKCVAPPLKFEPRFDNPEPLFDELETKPQFNIDTIKKNDLEEVENKPVVIPDNQWYTVGFFKDTSALVKDYFLCTNDGTDLNVDNLPDSSHVSRIALEPGAVYKFRVAAINTVGRSDWSPVSFKTFKQIFSK